MAGSFSRSMRLFSASWGVLKEDKSLLVFPVVSAVAGLGVVAFFAVPILLVFVHSTTTVDPYGMQQTHATLDPMGWVLVVIGYVATMYVGTFMNAALIVAANERLTGTGPGSVSSGFAGASRKAGAIFGWVVVASTVGLILQSLEQRFGLIGKIVIGLIGIAWSLLTFLIVPVIVLENNSTGVAISRSAKLFKGTWGENVIGSAGFGLFGFAVGLVAVGLFAVGLLTGTVVGIVTMSVLALIWLLIASQVLAAMSGVYRVALYRYAVDGQPPQAYVAFDFDGAFRAKKSSGFFGSPKTRTVYRSSNPAGVQVPVGQEHRDPWKAWEPPAEDPIRGEFGVEIPGAEKLPEHTKPVRPAVPPPPSFGTGDQRPDSRSWPGSSDWPGV